NGHKPSAAPTAGASAHRDDAAAIAPCGNLDLPRDEREDRPPAMEDYAGGNDQRTGHGTDGGAVPELGQAVQRYGMNGELAVIGNCLNDKDPAIGTAEPPADRTGETDMVARFAIVLREQRRPAGFEADALAADHGREEICFEQAAARPPDVE